MGIVKTPKDADWEQRDGTKTEGKVLKQVSVEEQFPWGDYADVIQLIKLRLVGGKRLRKPEYVIRFGYYVKDHGASEKKYTWGSQTTLIVRKAKLRRLLSKAEKNGLLD